MEWQPIATAPKADRGYILDERNNVLLWGRRFGVREGRACRYGDGAVFAAVAGWNGNQAEDGTVTHWMSLPEAPCPD